MASYAVESSRQSMLATGLVNEVKEWEDKPGGGRQISKLQARDEATGMPLWGVEVLYQQSAFGRESTVTAPVVIGSVDKPAPKAFTPVQFAGLTVEVRGNKSGGFSENWRADGLLGAAGKPTGPAPSSGQS